MKDESHKRELSTLRKRLVEAEGTIRRLEQLVKSQANTTRNTNGTSSYGDARRMEAEIRNLRAENEKLEEKLRVRMLLEFFTLLNLEEIRYMIDQIFNRYITLIISMEMSTIYSVYFNKFNVHFLKLRIKSDGFPFRKIYNF